MATNSSIEWTRGDDGSPGATWNVVTGCTKVSPGCDRCYAETFAERWRGTPGHHFENGFDITIRPERLTIPFAWRKPKRIFVNSMSDVFHADIPDDLIGEMFAVMSLTPHHIYQVLTKRHGRMRSLLNDTAFQGYVAGAATRMASDYGPDDPPRGNPVNLGRWPIPNVHLGVSCEDQRWADIRIPALLDTPAAVRWISAEPLLGPVVLRKHWVGADALMPDEYGLDWLVVGGESGPGARPMHPDWARDLRDQCSEAGVPFFFKQYGSYAPVTDRPESGDVWVRPDGSTLDWEPGEGHFRGGLGDFRQSDRRPSSSLVRKVGKKAAGRELDGRTWDEFPSTDGTPANHLPAGVPQLAPVEPTPAAPERVASDSSPLGEPDAFQTAAGLVPEASSASPAARTGGDAQ